MKFEWQHTLDAIDADTDTGAVVPQTYRALYSSVDGKFKLEDGLAKKLDVTGLTTALDKERKNVKAAKELADKWSALGETPEAVATKLQELQDAATKGDKVNFDKLKADLEAGHQRALTAKDGEITGMRKSVEKHLVESVAVAAITEAKGASELLLPHVRSNVKVINENGEYIVRVVDADGDPRGDGKGGFMSIKDLVNEMKASPVFGRAFEASGASGSGKQPGSGGKKTNVGTGAGSEGLSPTQKIQAGLQKGALQR